MHSTTLIKDIMKTPSKKITYATFMEWALYHPTYGYYMSEKDKVGKQGDFYTSSMIHPIFAKLFAKAFIEIFEKENLPYHICEFGGGNGKFAKDVLEEIKTLSHTIFSKVKYIIVETSPFHRDLQRKLLSEYQQIEIYADFKSLQHSYSNFDGIIFSNELFDAFPVHVVQMENDILNELFITVCNGELQETKEVCTNHRIITWLEKYGPKLIDGQKIEIPLAMEAWLEEITTWVNRGMMVTVDYGYTKEEWSSPERMDGSLRGYYHHKLISNPLLYPGEMDLTTHIHIDALLEQGRELQLETVVVQDQDRFLLSLGILDYLQDNFDPNPFSEKSKQNRAIRSLITDGSMSKGFKVILQEKSLQHTNEFYFVQQTF